MGGSGDESPNSKEKIIVAKISGNQIEIWFIFQLIFQHKIKSIIMLGETLKFEKF